MRRVAEKKNCTPAQVGLAWVLAGGDFIVPIPGMRKEERIVENLGASDIELNPEEYAELTNALSQIKIYGTRDGRDIKKLGTVPNSTIR